MRRLDLDEFLQYVYLYWLVAGVAMQPGKGPGRKATSTDNPPRGKGLQHRPQVTERVLGMLWKQRNAIRAGLDAVRYDRNRLTLALRRQDYRDTIKVGFKRARNIFFKGHAFFDQTTRFLSTRAYQQLRDGQLRLDRVVSRGVLDGPCTKEFNIPLPAILDFEGVVFNGYDDGTIWIGIRDDAVVPDLVLGRDHLWRAQKLQQPVEIINIKAVSGPSPLAWEVEAGMSAGIQAIANICPDKFIALSREIDQSCHANAESQERTEDSHKSRRPHFVCVTSGTATDIPGRLCRDLRGVAESRDGAEVAVYSALTFEETTAHLREVEQMVEFRGDLTVSVIDRDTISHHVGHQPWLWSKYFGGQRGFALVKDDAKRLAEALALTSDDDKALSGDGAVMHPALAELRHPMRVRVVGRSGAGKTAGLYQLACAQPGALVVVVHSWMRVDDWGLLRGMLASAASVPVVFVFDDVCWDTRESGLVALLMRHIRTDASVLFSHAPEDADGNALGEHYRLRAVSLDGPPLGFVLSAAASHGQNRATPDSSLHAYVRGRLRAGQSLGAIVADAMLQVLDAVDLRTGVRTWLHDERSGDAVVLVALLRGLGLCCVRSVPSEDLGVLYRRAAPMGESFAKVLARACADGMVIVSEEGASLASNGSVPSFLDLHSRSFLPVGASAIRVLVACPGELSEGFAHHAFFRAAGFLAMHSLYRQALRVLGEVVGTLDCRTRGSCMPSLEYLAFLWSMAGDRSGFVRFVQELVSSGRISPAVLADVCVYLRKCGWAHEVDQLVSWLFGRESGGVFVRDQFAFLEAVARHPDKVYVSWEFFRQVKDGLERARLRLIPRGLGAPEL